MKKVLRDLLIPLFLHLILLCAQYLIFNVGTYVSNTDSLRFNSVVISTTAVICFIAMFLWTDKFRYWLLSLPFYFFILAIYFDGASLMDGGFEFILTWFFVLITEVAIWIIVKIIKKLVVDKKEITKVVKTVGILLAVGLVILTTVFICCSPLMIKTRMNAPLAKSIKSEFGNKTELSSIWNSEDEDGEGINVYFYIEHDYSQLVTDDTAKLTYDVTKHIEKFLNENPDFYSGGNMDMLYVNFHFGGVTMPTNIEYSYPMKKSSYNDKYPNVYLRSCDHLVDFFKRYEELSIETN